MKEYELSEAMDKVQLCCWLVRALEGERIYIGP